MPRYLIVSILSLTGFLISAYIRYKKSKREKLACFIGKNCNKVIYSSYASTFGVPNEIAGMFYYGLIAIVSLCLFMNPALEADFIPLLLKIAVDISAVFFIYLILVQLTILKELCEWCLVSAGLSFIVFLFANGII